MSYVVRLEYAYGVCPRCKSNYYLRYLIHNDGLTHKPYEIKCTNCNSYFRKEDIFGSGEETAPKPITNYDLLIRKTPEEMAEWLTERTGRAGGFICLKGETKFQSWLDWLKQEARECMKSS